MPELPIPSSLVTSPPLYEVAPQWSVGVRARKPHALKSAPPATPASGCRARALRLLLLVVFALAFVEYLFISILKGLPVIREGSTSWPSKLSTKAVNISVLIPGETTKLIFENATLNSFANITSQNNITRLNSSLSAMPSPPLISRLMGNIEHRIQECRDPKKEILKKIVLPSVCNIPSDLGRVSADMTEMELSFVETKFPEVQRGGMFSPPNCKAKHKVAIIVPFRNRYEHLAIFLNHMHPFLMRQQLEYGIFIIEQKGNGQFNRAKLLNVGFAESQKQKAGGWQCFVFHDIDLLPLDLRNMYSCPRQPRHMSAAIDKFDYKLPYQEIFGGVSALTREQFEDVNGFSNQYWGWGGEDDDMAYRIKLMGYIISRYNISIAEYAMLSHKTATPNPRRQILLSQAYKWFHRDGLSSLEYQVVEINHHHLYTHVLVRI